MSRFITTILIAASLCLLVGLGFWQLQRAEQKQVLIAQQLRQFSQGEVELNPDQDDLHKVKYQHVFLQGRFDCDHQILLDNKLDKGRPGFHVITGFRPATATRSILVNRGWIAMDVNRTPVKDYLDCPQEMLQVKGVATGFPELGYHFSGSTDAQTDGWPIVLLELDAEKVSTALAYQVVNYILLMDQSMPGGFIRNWSFTPNISAQKHVAYAVQWFGLAITLGIIVLWKQRRKNQ
ncbi:MAG TPA: SURF1 family protein [Crenotrichaceae bacterium]|nr:SURF1 family protein [Crenotrichaceae bacterium]